MECANAPTHCKWKAVKSKLKSAICSCDDMKCIQPCIQSLKETVAFIRFQPSLWPSWLPFLLQFVSVLSKALLYFLFPVTVHSIYQVFSKMASYFHSILTACVPHFCFCFYLYFLVLLFLQRYLALKASVSSILKVCHFTLLGFAFKPVRSLSPNLTPACMVFRRSCSWGSYCRFSKTVIKPQNNTPYRR